MPVSAVQEILPLSSVVTWPNFPNLFRALLLYHYILMFHYACFVFSEVSNRHILPPAIQ